MNKVFLIGNLTRDPELSETNSGIPVCRFAIAVNRRFSSANGEQQTDFFNVTAWRNLAETVSRYTKKGNKVAVTGSIQIRNFEDNSATWNSSRPRAARTALPRQTTTPRPQRPAKSPRSRPLTTIQTFPSEPTRNSKRSLSWKKDLPESL